MGRHSPYHSIPSLLQSVYLLTPVHGCSSGHHFSFCPRRLGAPGGSGAPQPPWLVAGAPSLFGQHQLHIASGVQGRNAGGGTRANAFFWRPCPADPRRNHGSGNPVFAQLLVFAAMCEEKNPIRPSLESAFQNFRLEMGLATEGRHASPPRCVVGVWT